MNRKIIIFCLLSLISLFLFSGFKSQEVETADSIMNRASKHLSVQSEIGMIQIATTSNDGTVEQRRLISIMQKDPAGNFNYIVRFLSPEEITGVTLLNRETGDGSSEQYLYLPSLGKIREIKGGQKSSYFMGTDFTFEDLRLEKTVEYTYKRQLDKTVEGIDCYVILSKPADEIQLSNKVYSHRVIYVEKKKYNIVKIEYYDDAMRIAKTFQAYDYNSSEVDGPTNRPRRAVMTNHEKGTTSVMVLMKSRLNYQMDPNIFTTSTIENWTPEVTANVLSVFDTQQTQ